MDGMAYNDLTAALLRLRHTFLKHHLEVPVGLEFKTAKGKAEADRAIKATMPIDHVPHYRGNQAELVGFRFQGPRLQLTDVATQLEQIADRIRDS